jgi:hypothetical protein
MKKLWFKRRRFGYGWTPVTWQGWLTIAVFLLVVFAGLLLIPANSKTPVIDMFIYLAFVALAILGLVYVATKKGPSPKWRWGKKHDDNPREDF